MLIITNPFPQWGREPQGRLERDDDPMKLIYIFMSCILVLQSWAAPLKKMVIKTVAPLDEYDHRSDYYYALLKQAFKEMNIEAELLLVQRRVEQERQIAFMVDDGTYDVYFSMTSKNREEKLQAIYIPLAKGLLGYRIFIIRREDKAKFRAIRTLDDLKKFKAGQGLGWPDTEILQYNLGKGNVIVVPEYPFHFPMLQGKRFDYFPRGVHEPYDEIEPVGSLGYGKDLIVDDHLLIRYTAPFYFFVSKKDRGLARTITQGLKLAIKDGSFDALFIQYIQPTLNRAKLGNRLIFELENPFSSKETKAIESDRTLWYHIEN
jgi:hypothetical protein